MLLFETEDLIIENKKKQDYTTTFADNMSLPIHRWFRYTAGFSATWVKELIKTEKANGRHNIIDPFAGSGTVLLEAEFEEVNSFGIEAHQYIHKIASAKLLWNYPPDLFKAGCLDFLDDAKKKETLPRNHTKLILDCYTPDTLQKLETLRQVWLSYKGDQTIKRFTWFIITSILRTSSGVGTAQWQYVLPNKKKAKVSDAYQAFELKVLEMHRDMLLMQKKINNPIKSIVFQEDARSIQSIPDGWGDLVITSPPYANNYDYADATRLEMTFWGDIEGWGDLQDTVRKNLIRACTQHVAGMGNKIADIMANPRLKPIKDELLDVYNQLSAVRLTRGGKKNYHFMIAAYFNDLADVFYSLRQATRPGVKMCWVIGDSAPYGIYVPVDRWLGEIAIAAGFTDYSFEKLRDRNIKWKNRKHRVPLHEGRLWING